MQNQDTVTHCPVLLTQQAMGCKILLLYFFADTFDHGWERGGGGEGER